VRWEKDHKDDPEYMNKKFDLFHSCQNGTFVPTSMNSRCA